VVVAGSESGGAGLAAEAGLTVEVRRVEALGSEQLVHFTVDAPQVRHEGAAGGEAAGRDRDQVSEGEILAAPGANGVAVTAPRAAIRGGDRVRFAVDPGVLQFFDPDTHRAIR
jgi:multiple sugar transport system ATP-binding protein